MGKVFVPHVSSDNPNPSTSNLQPDQIQDSMRKNDDDSPTTEKEGSVTDWISGGPLGSKTAVLVFRSCVLASRTPSMESATKSIGNNTGTSILLNKAKNMARRLVAEPHSFSMRPKNIMHDVMETFGNGGKFNSQAYVVRHVSESDIPMTVSVDEQGHETLEHKRDIDDVLNDLNKITLKKHLNIENTTANIKQAEESPPSLKKDAKEDKKGKKIKSKHKRKNPQTVHVSTPSYDSDDSEHLLVKEVESVKVLESTNMPARLLKITYKLVNTETKLLHRLLQAHGLQEASSDAKDYNLLWSGLHPKPDVLRSMSPYQRVNHFPRSYELTRKDKLFKNIEKMQYFRGLKQFDFIPTTFLMPAEYKELCSTHYRTKGPWIVKPAASSRGRGIYIVNSPEQIPKGENVVVAKYVDKPLLIGGHKCDLRLYVAVTSIDPLLIYLYEEGLVRFATVKYDKTNKNLWNPCMHLCNYSINKYHTDYIKCDDPNAGNIGHKWTLSALLRHLRKQGRNTTALMAAIEDLVVKSILSSAQTITAAARVFVPNFFNCFELFGFDILIDDMLKPWLLEINLSPSLACESPLDARVKSALLADTLTLVGLPAVPMSKADISERTNSLKMRIGACRRVHSAENVCVRGKRGGPEAGGAGAGGAVECARRLLAARARADGAPARGDDVCTLTPLQVACGVGNLELVQLLLSHGADPFLSTQLNDALCYSAAAQYGCYSAVAVCCTHGRRACLRAAVRGGARGGGAGAVLSLEEVLAEGAAAPPARNPTFTKQQQRALQDAMYCAAETDHLDITLELHALGVPWSLHAWTLSLAAAADSALDNIIDQLLQDFLQVCPSDDSHYSKQFIYECLPLLFNILRYSKEGTVLLLADILCACYGREPVPPVTQPPPPQAPPPARVDPSYVNNPSLADVTFRVEGRLFYGHKIVLVSESPRLRAMLAPPRSSNEALPPNNSTPPLVQINDIRYHIFEQVMKYLYSGGCSGLDIPESDVLEVLAAASFFQLLPLQRHCEARAAKSVDLHNLVSVYIHAKVYGATQLLEYCQGFLLQNMVALLTYDDSVKRLLFGKRLPGHNVLGAILVILQKRIEARKSQAKNR